MSGCSGSQDCPRCDGEDTLMTSNDWKPFDTSSGTCLRCGFSFYTKVVIMNEKELRSERIEFDFKDKVKFTKEEKAKIKEFDKNSGWIE